MKTVRCSRDGSPRARRSSGRTRASPRPRPGHWVKATVVPCTPSIPPPPATNSTRFWRSSASVNRLPTLLLKNTASNCFRLSRRNTSGSRLTTAWIGPGLLAHQRRTHGWRARPMDDRRTRRCGQTTAACAASAAPPPPATEAPTGSSRGRRRQWVSGPPPCRRPRRAVRQAPPRPDRAPRRGPATASTNRAPSLQPSPVGPERVSRHAGRVRGNARRSSSGCGPILPMSTRAVLL